MCFDADTISHFGFVASVTETNWTSPNTAFEGMLVAWTDTLIGLGPSISNLESYLARKAIDAFGGEIIKIEQPPLAPDRPGIRY